MHLEHYEKKHLAMIRPGLPECTVLLRSNGDFPVSEPCPIDAFGGGVRHTIKGGTGSGEVNSRFFVTVETGLEKSGFTVTSKSWLDAYDGEIAAARQRFVREIKERARKNHTLALNEGMGAVMTEPEYVIPFEKHADTAIYVLSRISGEGNDRQCVKGDFYLTDTEIRDILAIQKLYSRFMLVLNTGGPVDLSPVMGVDNILLLSQLGVDTGLVLAWILLGKMVPSGKLATTWAAGADLPCIGDFGCEDDTRYKEGIYVGYRYYESAGRKPLFPFGHGLSYTSFAVKNAAASLEKETVTVTADVENTGSHAGKETLQLYVSVPEGRLDQPRKVLAGFQKTKLLTPGETESVRITFAMSEIASFDASSAAMILEKGDYLLRIGTSSEETALCGAVRVANDVTVRKLSRKMGVTDFEDWKPEGEETPEEKWEGEVLLLAEDAIAQETVSYVRKEEIDPSLEAFTNEELAHLVTGAFEEKGRGLGAVGIQSTTVAGAAGETTRLYENKGIPGMVFSDGPAGVRISSKYYQDGEKLYVGSTLFPESLTPFVPKPFLLLTRLTTKKPPKDALEKEQYCTAIPIGTAIAQSWDPAFAAVCGDVVGREMERFGISLWLAPALNIHRSILCGRNFEYYSEDPLLTGLIGAAITEGVQRHPGRGVTIKHFAANNQEFNRYQNNSVVSERALREIYLKGFEICIKKAHPKAVMTSYNLLNGIHTSESRELTQDILRAEFGFDGIVMTDWIIQMLKKKNAKYDYPHAGAIIQAGGDLVMPGSAGDYEDILQALRGGRITRKQLLESASRVSRMAKTLTENAVLKTQDVVE